MQWVTTYNGVYSNLIGEERAEALRHIEHDGQFDSWLNRFSRERNTTTSKKPGMRHVTQDDFIDKIQKKVPGIEPQPKQHKND